MTDNCGKEEGSSRFGEGKYQILVKCAEKDDKANLRFRSDSID